MPARQRKTSGYIGRLSWHWGTEYRWVRWGRYVLHATHARIYPRFSERIGLHKTVQFGPWRYGLRRDTWRSLP